MVLPSNLASKYPKDGRKGEDSSPVHITALYVDEIKKVKDKKGEYLQAIEEVCKRTKPFTIKLGETKSLVNPENKTVYYSSIESEELRKFNSALKRKLESKKLSFSKKFRGFKPHVTIEYVEEGKESKYKDKKINGQWEVNFVWVWGWGSPSIVFLGG